MNEIVDVKLPQWGMGMADGTILEWNKKAGDTVEEGELLASIEAAKTEEELLSPATGVVSELLFEIGSTVPVYTVIARIQAA